MIHHTVATTTLAQMPAHTRRKMFQLRYETFFERLQWNVKVADGEERDEFDDVDTAHYIIASDPAGHVDACWRLLPTLGPNMLRDTFAQLLHGQPAPAAADVWELSRFAVASTRLPADESAGNHQVGFGELSVALMAESTRFARSRGIARYVTVTTAAIERMLKKQGVNVRRLGPPVRIGSVLTVACFIEIDDVTLRALGELS